VRDEKWVRVARPTSAILTASFLLLTTLEGQSSSSPGISDNSFPIEEAYNQDPGVVQHISNFSRADEGGSWVFSFNQEWPLRGLRHQISYSIPLLHEDGTGAHRLNGVGKPLVFALHSLLAGDLAIAR
jgi:hypothetical protein